MKGTPTFVVPCRHSFSGVVEPQVKSLSHVLLSTFVSHFTCSVFLQTHLNLWLGFQFDLSIREGSLQKEGHQSLHKHQRKRGNL